MATATFKKATKELGLSPDDVVTYHKKGGKGIIEVDFNKLHRKKSNQNREKNAFESILSMAEDVGIKDWSYNHDHYLYGTPKRKTEE